MVSGDPVHDEVSKGSKSPHISKNGDVELFQGLGFQGRGCKVFGLGECPSLLISYSLIVSFEGNKILHNSSIDSTMEASNFAYVVGMIGGFYFVI